MTSPSNLGLACRDDFYFVEYAGGENKHSIFQSLVQYQLIKEAVLPKTKNIYFKNIWQQPRNDVYWMSKLYKDHAIFIRDVLITSNSKYDVPVIVEFMLCKDSLYLKQTCSTVLTCISLAAIAGFKKIVLHGIDLYGPHFFEMENFKKVRSTELPKIKKTGCYKYQDVEELIRPHSTERQAIPLSLYLSSFYKVLEAKGIELMTASHRSFSSRILPVAAL